MLRDYLSPDFTIIAADETYGARSIESLRRSLWRRVAGKRIIIHCRPEHTIQCIFALDGVVKEAVLAPFDACDKFIRMVEGHINADYVLVDESTREGGWLAQELPIEGAGGSDHFGPELETTWLIATSGTTSTPKLVAHGVDSLCRTVSKKYSPEDVWGLLYDPSRFAGLQVLIQAAAIGSSLVVPDPEDTFSSRVRFLADSACTALSATPSLWRKILMSIGDDCSMELKQVTLGGEIADQAIIDTLKFQFPGAVIVHIYASTEAGVGFSVRDKRAGFPSVWLEEGPRDVDLKVSELGTLLLRSKIRTQRYFGLDEEIIEEDGWIDTGDMVDIVEDRVFFLGRLNGSINIGGNKVFPEEVETFIGSLKEVSTVAIFPRKSSITGSLIEAHVVPKNKSIDKSELKKKIKSHCRGGLADFKVPAFIRIVDEISVTSAGKKRRGDG